MSRVSAETPIAAPGSDLRSRRRLTLLAALVLPPGLILLSRVAPTQGGWYPPCLLHWATGLHCPGCGTTRALHALLNGDWRQALAYNALNMLVLPFALWYGLHHAVAALAGWPAPRLHLPRWLWLFVGVLMILFTVARNLPWEPVCRLAPHEIEK